MRGSRIGGIGPSYLTGWGESPEGESREGEKRDGERRPNSKLLGSTTTLAAGLPVDIRGSEVGKCIIFSVG